MNYYKSKMTIPLASGENNIPIEVPENLSIWDNLPETSMFIKRLPELVLEKKERVRLYFEKLKYVEPAAALMLTSEIYRCQNLFQERRFSRVNGNFPRSATVYQQLSELGFYSLLKIPAGNPPEVTTEDRPVFIRFLTQNIVLSEQASLIIGKIIGMAFDVEENTKMYLGSAVVEAMNNVVEHAYRRKGRYMSMRNRWWLGGMIDRSRKEFLVLLYDQGIGIPETLDPPVWQEAAMLLKSGFSLHVDGAKIALATKLGQTSSRQPGRGKGFETMKKAVRACDEGELLVVSNGGYYIYSQDEEEQFGSLDVPIEGTLIQWRVKHASSTMRINDEDENDIGREGF